MASLVINRAWFLHSGLELGIFFIIHFRQIRQHFGALVTAVNLFALIISSTTLAKFRQSRHFHQIRQHFGALLAGLIYSLLSFRQQPWRNFAKIAIFATACKFLDLSLNKGTKSKASLKWGIDLRIWS